MERASQTQDSFSLDSRPRPPWLPGCRENTQTGWDRAGKEPICSLFPPCFSWPQPLPVSWTHVGLAQRSLAEWGACDWACQAVMWASGRKVSLPSGQGHPHAGDGETDAQRREGTPAGPPSMPGPMTVATLSCFSPSWLGEFLHFV